MNDHPSGISYEQAKGMTTADVVAKAAEFDRLDDLAKRLEERNGPLLNAIHVTPNRRSLSGHVLVRRDGRAVRVEDAREGDWRDLIAQIDEANGRPNLRLVDGGAAA